MIVKQIQDSEGDWYWIPIDKVPTFEIAQKAMDGKKYMDAPETFDSFERLYSQYATGGDVTLIPEAFITSNVEFETTPLFTVTMEEDWVESFTITPQLRFVKREVKIDKETAYNARILQQRWQGNKGTEKWEDVPLVD